MVRITSYLTGLDIRIVTFLLRNLTEEFSIREIARQTKTDYKLTHSTIQRLTDKGILGKKRKANLDLCSLNLNGDLTGVFTVEMLRAQEFLEQHPSLKDFFCAIKNKVKTTYYSLVVFGSFAKGSETPASDIDLIIITPHRAVGEEIERIVNNEAVLLGRSIQSLVLDEKEFIENLASKKLNVVVEAFKNHIIITGVEGFYNGVRQAL